MASGLASRCPTPAARAAGCEVRASAGVGLPVLAPEKRWTFARWNPKMLEARLVWAHSDSRHWTAMEDQPNLDPKLLRPKDVLEQTGITHQILYRYITLGLIEPALSGKPGLRLFHPNVVPLIKLIQSITRNGGYSLRDLKDIFFKDERVRKLTAK